MTFRINLPIQVVYNELTAHYMAQVVSRNMEFIDDGNTRQMICRLAEILVSPVSKFGILLAGTCGNGKTTLMYAIRSFMNSLGKEHFRFMGDKFEFGMPDYDAKRIVEISKTNNSEWREIREKDMLAIDDLGKEPTEILDYGNPRSPVVDLLEERYQAQRFTIVTTNLTPKDLSAKYGARLADRFREMFEVVIFNFDSYRGKTNRIG